MEPIDIKALEEAVVLFYRSSSNQQAAAHEWLTKAQASPQAWSFSWELMRSEKTQEVQFFGAITLHSKLMKYWHEVPPENRDELKQKLFEAIIAFASGPKLVLNRLCIALSAFIVHMLKDWPTAIEDVINTFQNQQIPNVTLETQFWIMLEILSGIPEESNAIYTSVQRVTLRAEINKRTPLVMQTIENYLEIQVNRKWSDEEMGNLTKAAKCAETWIKNGGYQIDCCQKLADLLLKITSTTYWKGTQEGDGCLSADENELCEAALKTLFAMMIQPESHRYPKTAFALIKMFLDSLSDIARAEWKENNLNEDVVVNIYTLFISSIERHSRLLLTGVFTEGTEHRELYTRLINEVLACTDKPGIFPVEESCSSLAMGFWYMLQDEVFLLENIEERNRCWELIQPLYAHLTRILVRKAQHPHESELDRWNADDLETFRCYRQDIADTLMYCYEVLHNHILDILTFMLDEAIVEIQVDPNTWPRLEACIFGFRSVAEHIDNIEHNRIPHLMRVLSEIPYEKLNEKLLGTALETVGSYCQWLKDNPDYIPPAINLLVKGLNSSMASPATLGLKELCRDCQVQLKRYAEPLLQACQSSIQSGRLKNSECVRLMFSVGKLMSMLPADKIPLYLDALVSPCFEELQLIAQQAATTDPAKIRTLYRLNSVSTLFSSLNTNTDDERPMAIPTASTLQPVLLVMQKTMPIFKQISELWIEKVEVVEAICNALKHAVKNLMVEFKPMLQDLCYLIISIFQNKCCAPALEVAKTCIVMFYKDEDCKNLMQQLLVEVVLYTFRLFEQTPENNFSELVDIVEGFYGFHLQIVKKHPSCLSHGSVDLRKLIDFALKAITMQENGPIRNGVQFISHFTMQSRQYPDMMQTILDKGENVIKTTILCIGCHTPRSQVDKFADIFLSLNKKYSSEMVMWMKMLGTADFPTSLISHNEKMKFMNQVIREKVNKRLIQNYINDFAAKSRGVIEKI